MSLNQLQTEYEAAKAEFIDKATAALDAEFKEVFELYPNITAIKWVQMIPYFNDGDACEFYVNDMYVTNAPDVENLSRYGDEYEGEADADWNNDSIDTVADPDKVCVWCADKFPKIAEIEAFAQSDGGEDVFENVFGSHAVVTVTREGIDVEEYEDHD
jgi:hypothetical protein